MVSEPKQYVAGESLRRQEPNRGHGVRLWKGSLGLWWRTQDVADSSTVTQTSTKESCKQGVETNLRKLEGDMFPAVDLRTEPSNILN